MSIASFAIAEASIADAQKGAGGAKKPSPRRTTVALPDTRLMPEAR